jgi:hypothetical protein
MRELARKSDSSEEGSLGISPSSDALGTQAMEILKRNGPTNVKDLFYTLHADDASITEAEVTDLVWRLAEQGKIALDDFQPIRSFTQFLRAWEKNGVLYGSLAISIALTIITYAAPLSAPFPELKWVLGSIFVLFIPGYVTVSALFPKVTDLDSIERLALSVGLSLVLIPFLGVLLSIAPFGIGLAYVLPWLIILTFLLSMVAIFRGYSAENRH